MNPEEHEPALPEKQEERELPCIKQLPPKATKINKLILDGFKSFGRRTELLFGDDLNVVLGPNGSGKSNVLDAICFVLGRISAKSMRAEKSVNLIYNGGKAKQPAKSAEVSIVFDNTSRVFPIDEDEIKVTRIVRTSGNNAYKINGKTRTRTETLELLSHARIYPDGYNIVLQGDIVRFVEMSSIERRQIIEDMAGIGVYEEKKEQALRELERVDKRIGDAEIILKERAGYLRDLKKDRDQALKHKKLSDKIRINKASWLKRQIDKKQAELDALAKKSGKHKTALANLQEEQGSLRKEIDARKIEIKAISQDIESKGEVENIQIQKDIETLRVDIATHTARISACRNELVRIAKRREELKANVQDIESRVGKSSERVKELAARREFLLKEQAQVDEAVGAFRRKHKLDDSDDLSKNIMGIDSKAEELGQQAQSLRETNQELVREKDKIDFQIQTMDDRVAKIKELEEQHKSEVETLKRNKAAFKKVVMELNTVLNRDSKDAGTIAEARRTIQNLHESLAKLEVKQASIREVIGSNIAIQKILANKGKLGEIYGTVAELGEVSSKYATALDIAAAQRMQSIVVDDDATATGCIKYLKSNRFGIATFLPLNKIKGMKVDAKLKQLAKHQGVHGFAIDLIDFDPKFRTVFQHVLGSTLVVNNIETARKVGIGKVRMVTLDGDLAEYSGAMIGGYRAKRKGAFREKELGAKLERARKLLGEEEARLSALESAREKNESRIERLRETKAQLEGDIIKAERSLHIDTEDLDASREYKQELMQKREDIEAQMRTLEEEIASKTGEITQLKIKKQQMHDQMQRLRAPTLVAQLNAFEQKRKQIHEELVNIDAENKQLESQQHNLLEPEQQKTADVLKEMEKEEESLTKEANDLGSLCETLEADLKSKEKAQEQFQSQFKELFQTRNRLSDEITAREKRLLEVDQAARQEELMLNTFSIEEARIKAENSGFAMEFEQYAGIELDTETPEEQLKKSIVEFERMMATIGSVNMRSLDIYDAAEKEYKSLQGKKAKLSEEKDCVIAMMDAIEVNKKSLFLNALKAADQNFQDIFSKLSTKGRAFLTLENPDSPFDAGVRIKVNIVGDKFLDIRSLSGGEKTLTALAFIFAIQEHTPASFYVLDEVDAALDKHNSSKLANLLRKYTARAQYLVISHNDNVIGEGDVLWGISMPDQKTAISTAVSMRM